MSDPLAQILADLEFALKGTPLLSLRDVEHRTALLRAFVERGADNPAELRRLGLAVARLLNAWLRAELDAVHARAQGNPPGNRQLH